MNARTRNAGLARLRRLLWFGVGLASSGVLLVIASAEAAFERGPGELDLGLMALFFGLGSMMAAWLGFANLGATRFTLRTLLRGTTLLAALCAAWLAWVGPCFFDSAEFSLHGGQLMVARPALIDGNPDGRAFVGPLRTLELPIFRADTMALVLFPLVLLPCVLRHSDEPEDPPSGIAGSTPVRRTD